jgi:uncharacterized membrane protein YhdT
MCLKLIELVYLLAWIGVRYGVMVAGEDIYHLPRWYHAIAAPLCAVVFVLYDLPGIRWP